MTDNEIINALECCCSPKVNACDDCPFHKRCYENNEWLEKEAIDLINRQKAEIERLRAVIDRQKDDIELFDIEHKAIKADAIKEFAERLHEYINGIIERHEMPMFPFSVAFVSGMEAKIDNLVKEMVGETNV